MGSKALVMSPFPTRGRRGHAESGEKMEQEGDGKRKGRHSCRGLMTMREKGGGGLGGW